MEVVATLKARCDLCRSFNLEIMVGKDFEGIVVECRACSFQDFIGNPFADFRMFMDLPKNWCFIHTGKSLLL